MPFGTPSFNRGFFVPCESGHLLYGHNIRPRCQFLFIKLPHHKQIMLGQRSRLRNMGLLVIALRRLVVFGVKFPIFQIMNYIGCLNLEAPGFLSAVQAGDKAALQKKEASLFADMTNAVHLIFCHVDGVLLKYVLIFGCCVHVIHLSSFFANSRRSVFFLSNEIIRMLEFAVKTGLAFSPVFSPFSPNSLLFPGLEAILRADAVSSNFP